MSQQVQVPNQPKPQVQRGKITVDGKEYTYKILKHDIPFLNKLWKLSNGMLNATEPILEGVDDMKILQNAQLKAAKLNQEIEMQVLAALDVKPPVDPTDIWAFKIGRRLLTEVINGWFSEYFLA